MFVSILFFLTVTNAGTKRSISAILLLLISLIVILLTSVSLKAIISLSKMGTTAILSYIFVVFTQTDKILIFLYGCSTALSPTVRYNNEKNRYQSVDLSWLSFICLCLSSCICNVTRIKSQNILKRVIFYSRDEQETSYSDM